MGEKPGDKPIGDEYDQCYESTARLVATKVGVKDSAVDIWDSMKGAITNNIKDVIMSCDFDELFSTGEDSKELGVCLNNRKILEIEKTVLENVKKSGLDKGLALKVVDINEVHFPDEIKDKLTELVTAFLDAKIRKNEAQTKAYAAEIEANAKVIVAEVENKIKMMEVDAKRLAKITDAEAEETAARYKSISLLQIARAKIDAKRLAKITDAEAEQTVAGYKSQSLLEIARAKAHSEVAQGRGKAEARAEYCKQVLDVLQAYGHSSPETVNIAIKNLGTSISTERLFRFLVRSNSGGYKDKEDENRLDHDQDEDTELFGD